MFAACLQRSLGISLAGDKGESKSISTHSHSDGGADLPAGLEIPPDANAAAGGTSARAAPLLPGGE
jgi:hypothetical protein